MSTKGATRVRMADDTTASADFQEAAAALFSPLAGGGRRSSGEGGRKSGLSALEEGAGGHADKKPAALVSGMERLAQALRCQPGIGPRSAQRIAFHLMQRDRDAARSLGEALLHAVAHVHHCELCNNFSETRLCDICSSSERDVTRLCVVEMPTDLMLLESTRTFNGLYFVLMGYLSPLDGIGPRDLHMPQLIARAGNGAVREIVLATGFSNEGEATAFYISELLKTHDLVVTRLARGVPSGAGLDYVDPATLARAMLDRR